MMDQEKIKFYKIFPEDHFLGRLVHDTFDEKTDRFSKLFHYLCKNIINCVCNNEGKQRQYIYYAYINNKWIMDEDDSIVDNILHKHLKPLYKKARDVYYE